MRTQCALLRVGGKGCSRGERAAAAAEEDGAAAVGRKKNASNDRLTPTIGCLLDGWQLTSLGGVSVPSTSNRHRTFRCVEKPFKVSIPGRLGSARLGSLFSSPKM